MTGLIKPRSGLELGTKTLGVQSIDGSLPGPELFGEHVMVYEGIDLGIVEFALESDDPIVVDILGRIFRPSPPMLERARQVGGSRPSLRVTINSSAPSGQCLYVVEVEGKGQRQCTGWEWAVHIAASLMTDVLTSELNRQFTTFHAAAFSHGGQGILVPGASHSGKSTTAAVFALSGFRHYTDDIASLDENLGLLPFPRAIALRDGGWDCVNHLFPKEGEARLIWGCDTTVCWYVDPLHPNTEQNAGPHVSLILLPTRDLNVPTLTPLTRSEAIPALIDQCFGMAVDPRVSLERIMQIAGEAECYRVNMARPLEAVHAVEALVNA